MCSSRPAFFSVTILRVIIQYESLESSILRTMVPIFASLIMWCPYVLFSLAVLPVPSCRHQRRCCSRIPARLLYQYRVAGPTTSSQLVSQLPSRFAGESCWTRLDVPLDMTRYPGKLLRQLLRIAGPTTSTIVTSRLAGGSLWIRLDILPHKTRYYQYPGKMFSSKIVFSPAKSLCIGKNIFKAHLENYSAKGRWGRPSCSYKTASPVAKVKTVSQSQMHSWGIKCRTAYGRKVFVCTILGEKATLHLYSKFKFPPRGVSRVSQSQIKNTCRTQYLV